MEADQPARATQRPPPANVYHDVSKIPSGQDRYETSPPAGYIGLPASPPPRYVPTRRDHPVQERRRRVGTPPPKRPLYRPAPPALPFQPFEMHGDAVDAPSATPPEFNGDLAYYETSYEDSLEIPSSQPRPPGFGLLGDFLIREEHGSDSQIVAPKLSGEDRDAPKWSWPGPEDKGRRGSPSRSARTLSGSFRRSSPIEWPARPPPLFPAKETPLFKPYTSQEDKSPPFPPPVPPPPIPDSFQLKRYGPAPRSNAPAPEKELSVRVTSTYGSDADLYKAEDFDAPPPGYTSAGQNPRPMVPIVVSNKGGPQQPSRGEQGYQGKVAVPTEYPLPPPRLSEGPRQASNEVSKPTGSYGSETAPERPPPVVDAPPPSYGPLDAGYGPPESGYGPTPPPRQPASYPSPASSYPAPSPRQQPPAVDAAPPAARQSYGTKSSQPLGDPYSPPYQPRPSPSEFSPSFEPTVEYPPLPDPAPPRSDRPQSYPPAPSYAPSGGNPPLRGYSAPSQPPPPNFELPSFAPQLSSPSYGGQARPAAYSAPSSAAFQLPSYENPTKPHSHPAPPRPPYGSFPSAAVPPMPKGDPMSGMSAGYEPSPPQPPPPAPEYEPPKYGSYKPPTAFPESQAPLTEPQYPGFQPPPLSGPPKGFESGGYQQPPPRYEVRRSGDGAGGYGYQTPAGFGQPPKPIPSPTKESSPHQSQSYPQPAYTPANPSPPSYDPTGPISPAHAVPSPSSLGPSEVPHPQPEPSEYGAASQPLPPHIGSQEYLGPLQGDWKRLAALPSHSFGPPATDAYGSSSPSPSSPDPNYEDKRRREANGTMSHLVPPQGSPPELDGYSEAPGEPYLSLRFTSFGSRTYGVPSRVYRPPSPSYFSGNNPPGSPAMAAFAGKGRFTEASFKPALPPPASAGSHSWKPTYLSPPPTLASLANSFPLAPTQGSFGGAGSAAEYAPPSYAPPGSGQRTQLRLGVTHSGASSPSRTSTFKQSRFEDPVEAAPPARRYESLPAYLGSSVSWRKPQQRRRERKTATRQLRQEYSFGKPVGQPPAAMPLRARKANPYKPRPKPLPHHLRKHLKSPDMLSSSYMKRDAALPPDVYRANNIFGPPTR